jgi:hypothetical protein
MGTARHRLTLFKRLDLSATPCYSQFRSDKSMTFLTVARHSWCSWGRVLEGTEHELIASARFRCRRCILGEVHCSCGLAKNTQMAGKTHPLLLFDYRYRRIRIRVMDKRQLPV